MLRQLPRGTDRKVLVGAGTADDAGVYRLDARRALVQTVDFFTPIVDDPFQYGSIAAANALSDVYAMGGRPLTALNVMGMPADRVPAEVIARILRGGAAKAREAGCAVIGGHTIRSPEPIYGLSVTGLVHPGRLITNDRARPGDHIILTKPLGTGIVTTGVKRNLASTALVRRTVRAMKALNTVGATLAERGWVIAGTDVTGFGLLGHLGSMCRQSEVGAELNMAAIPVLGAEVWDLIDRDCVPGGTRQNLTAVESIVDWSGASAAQRLLLADAQTSGGLLVCVPERHVTRVMLELRRQRTLCAARIGRIVRSARPHIRLRA